MVPDSAKLYVPKWPRDLTIGPLKIGIVVAIGHWQTTSDFLQERERGKKRERERERDRERERALVEKGEKSDAICPKSDVGPRSSADVIEHDSEGLT